jgi:hypothetical protein
MCMSDTLKRSNNLLNIKLDSRKSSFVEEIVDNSNQSCLLESISTHGTDQSLYLC